VKQVPRRGADLELIAVAVGEIGYENLPHARRHQAPHDVRAPVPVIEVADHAHALRVGRPHREVHAGDAAYCQTMGAKLLPGPVMGPFAEQVQIEVGEDLAELVGIDDVAGDPAFAHAEAVGEVLRTAVERQRRLEQAVRPPALHAVHPIVGDQLHVRRRRLHRPDQKRRLPVHDDTVPAQYRKRVVTRPGDDGVDRLVIGNSHTNGHVLMISF
jgi:hypothetical protein